MGGEILTTGHPHHPLSPYLLQRLQDMASEQASSPVPHTNPVQGDSNLPERSSLTAHNNQNSPAAPHRQSVGIVDVVVEPFSIPRSSSPEKRQQHDDVLRTTYTATPSDMERGLAAGPTSSPSQPTSQVASPSLGLGAGRPLPPHPPATPPAPNAAAGEHARDRGDARTAGNPFASREGSLGEPHSSDHGSTRISAEPEPFNLRHQFIHLAGDLIQQNLLQGENTDSGSGGNAPVKDNIGARVANLAVGFAEHNIGRLLTPRAAITPGSPTAKHSGTRTGGDYFSHRNGSQPTSPILRTPGESFRTPRQALNTPGIRVARAEPSLPRSPALCVAVDAQNEQMSAKPDLPPLPRELSDTQLDRPPSTRPDIIYVAQPEQIGQQNGDTLNRRFSRSVAGRSHAWDNQNLSRHDTMRSNGRQSIIDHVVPTTHIAMLDENFIPGTVNARIHATITHAREQRDKYALQAKWTGWALNIAIGLQVLLGSLTTGLSAVAVNGKSAAVSTTILGALATLVASYLARARGSNEPELSITRTKDLDQFIREVENFKMDHGYESGEHYNSELERYRMRFEELLGNVNGERKPSNAISSKHGFMPNGGNGGRSEGRDPGH